MSKIITSEVFIEKKETKYYDVYILLPITSALELHKTLPKGLNPELIIKPMLLEMKYFDIVSGGTGKSQRTQFKNNKKNAGATIIEES